MGLLRTTDPATGAVSLDTLKTNIHLHPSIGDEQDSVLQLYIDAATADTEDYLRRSLITQEWELSIDGTPEWPVELYRPPVQELLSVTAYDEDDVAHTVDLSEFRVDNYKGPARLLLTGEMPDVVLREYNSVIIEYRAGYGDEEGDIPANIRQGVLLWASMSDQNRAGETEIPEQIKHLLSKKRLYDRPGA